jgi:hypothetical protein
MAVPRDLPRERGQWATSIHRQRPRHLLQKASNSSCDQIRTVSHLPVRNEAHVPKDAGSLIDDRCSPAWSCGDAPGDSSSTAAARIAKREKCASRSPFKTAWAGASAASGQRQSKRRSRRARSQASKALTKSVVSLAGINNEFPDPDHRDQDRRPTVDHDGPAKTASQRCIRVSDDEASDEPSAALPSFPTAWRAPALAANQTFNVTPAKVQRRPPARLREDRDCVSTAGTPKVRIIGSSSPDRA